jgi:hypothetical protein
MASREIAKIKARKKPVLAHVTSNPMLETAQADSTDWQLLDIGIDNAQQGQAQPSLVLQIIMPSFKRLSH